MAKQITLGVEENGISFTFDESTHYLYGDGKIVCPKNSLILVTDESEMFTLKKANGDVFISARYDAVEGISSKEDLVDWFIENAVGNVGGGSVDPEQLAGLIADAEYISSATTIAFYNLDGDEVCSIDATAFIKDGMVSNVEVVGTNLVITFNTDAGKNPISIPLTSFFDGSRYYDKTATDALLSGKADTSAVTASINELSAATDTKLANKQDALHYYSENTEDGTVVIHVESELPILSLSTFATDNHDDLIELDNRVFLNDVKDDGSGNTADASIIIDTGEISFDVTRQENEETYHTYMLVNPSAVTINDERVLTESDGVYYIDFAKLTTQGITDADWDGMVAAINAHRPIYAGLPGANGLLYYTSECLYQDGSNTIRMTASDNAAHYFYTFVKNGSNDYSFNYETRPYTTQAEKTAWNAKQDTLVSGTNIKTVNNETLLGSGNLNLATTSAVTQAEYDAALAGGTLDTDMLYIITDASAIDIQNYMTSAQTVSAITEAVSGKAETSALTQHISDSNAHFTGSQKSNYDAFEGQFYVDDSWDVTPLVVFNDFFQSEYPAAMGQFDQRITSNTNAIASKADTSAVTASINELSAATDTKLAAKANVLDLEDTELTLAQAINVVDGKVSAKANAADVYTKSEIDDMIGTAITQLQAI